MDNPAECTMPLTEKERAYITGVLVARQAVGYYLYPDGERRSIRNGKSHPLCRGGRDRCTNPAYGGKLCDKCQGVAARTKSVEYNSVISKYTEGGVRRCTAMNGCFQQCCLPAQSGRRVCREHRSSNRCQHLGCKGVRMFSRTYCIDHMPENRYYVLDYVGNVVGERVI